MGVLIAGLLLFFLPHSLRIVGEEPRRRWMRLLGEGGYKGLYSLLSLAGLVLIASGYGEARGGPPIYVPGEGARHLALLIAPVGFVAIAAAYTPAGFIKARLRHPMVVGVALWALAHLLANGTLADILLFGSFLGWALADLVSAIIRQPMPAAPSAARFGRGDLLAILAGLVGTVILLAGLHRALFGVSPLG